jgi:SapC
MINPELHKKPVALDRNQHRTLKLNTMLDNLAAAEHLNAFFITAVEFGDVCKEYPILFLRAGTDEHGKPQVAPTAVFGLARGENLYYNQAAGAPDERWRARYVPAMLRAYPFAMARLDSSQFAIAIDESWSGFSQTEGRPLFDEQGTESAFLKEMGGFVERIEAEVERTRRIGLRLMELNLLQEKRFDATLPDGSPLSVDGFLAVDEKRLAELSDAEVGELHRTGLLGLLHAHQLSLSNMTMLIDRRLKASGQTQAPAAAGPAA